MKNKLFLFMLLLLSTGYSRAQNYNNVKPYIAIIKTQERKIKGLFVKIDSQKVILYFDDKYQEINTADIKSIKLRVTKPSYQLQSYFFNNLEKNQYTYLNQQGKRVDKWGHEEPTATEEVATVVVGVVGEAIANVVAGSLHNINPNVANYKFKNGFNYNELDAISYFSVHYQQHPNTLAELKKIKEISEKAKNDFKL